MKIKNDFKCLKIRLICSAWLDYRVFCEDTYLRTDFARIIEENPILNAVSKSTRVLIVYFRCEITCKWDMTFLVMTCDLCVCVYFLSKFTLIFIWIHYSPLCDEIKNIGIKAVSLFFQYFKIEYFVVSQHLQIWFGTTKCAIQLKISP